MTAVTVTGHYGDSWLEELYPRNVGPSSVAYRFDTAVLIEEFEDGSALVETMSADGRGRHTYHTDGSYCGCFPCTHGKQAVWRRVRHYKRRRAVVPAGHRQYGGRGIIHTEVEISKF